MIESEIEAYITPLCVEQKSTLAGLTHYRLLGKSGLRVSPLCLGTGGKSGELWCPPWMVSLQKARPFLHHFIEAGGNFIDTADCYHHSEAVIGSFLGECPDRDALVIATKCSFSPTQGDPNNGGNSRKYLLKALDNSLRRLQTDYVDVLWIHNWDTITPVEELMSTLHQLVQTNKVRYIGLSNIPAWYLARAQTLAEWRGFEKICAIQMEYSLAMRTIEFEFFPAAKTLGVGICAWGPLANGLLSGKYHISDRHIEGQGRISEGQAIDPYIDPNHHKIQKMVTHLKFMAQQLERTPAQIALNWVNQRPNISSTLIGVTTLQQLTDNLQALEFTLPTEFVQQLDELSQPPSCYPYFFHEDAYLAQTLSKTRIEQKT